MTIGRSQKEAGKGFGTASKTVEQSPSEEGFDTNLKTQIDL